MIHWVWAYYVFTHLEIIIWFKTLIGLYCEICFQIKSILKEKMQDFNSTSTLKKNKEKHGYILHKTLTKL